MRPAMLDMDSGVVPRKGDIPVSLCVWVGECERVWGRGQCSVCGGGGLHTLHIQ